MWEGLGPDRRAASTEREPTNGGREQCRRQWVTVVPHFFGKHEGMVWNERYRPRRVLGRHHLILILFVLQETKREKKKKRKKAQALDLMFVPNVTLHYLVCFVLETVARILPGPSNVQPPTPNPPTPLHPGFSLVRRLSLLRSGELSPFQTLEPNAKRESSTVVLRCPGAGAV